MSDESTGEAWAARQSQRVYAVIGVLIAMGWPFVKVLVYPEPGSALASVRDDVRTIVIEWSVVLILSIIAFGLQGLRPAYFRLRIFNWRDVLIMLAAFVAALMFSGAVSRLVTAPKFDLRQAAAIPIAVRAGLVLTAAVCEEFMFRGFAIEEIGALVGNRWIGAVLSLVFFGLGHVGVYGFSTALLIPMSVGLVITLLYMFRNNLPVCMLMHAMVDGLFLILIPTLVHP
jgi:uncharacterized protein